MGSVGPNEPKAAVYDFIAKSVRGFLPSPDVSFVFPSEVAAASWARRALKIADVRVVDSDRFLGWDTFKERLFSGARDERPADRRVRVLWAASALAENARNPFLKTLIRPEHRDEHQGYVPYVAGILPSLKRIHDRAGRVPGDSKVRDLSTLYERYRSFLSDRRLYEPSYESIPSGGPEGTYTLFCPELAQDFEEYSEALSCLPSVRVVHLPDRIDPPTLLEFPNVYEELRWIFLSVARDLDEGLRPEEIAVTITDVDRCVPWVRKAAESAGVPAEIRSGTPLSGHPVGRFLSALGACSERGFDLESVTALLLDQFLPWREPETVRSLVRFGMRNHAYAPFRDKGRLRDCWLESLRICAAPDTSLESFYRRLKTGAEELTGAKDFGALASAFVKFRKSFLDESTLSDEDERSFQRAMVEAEGFAQESTALGLPAAGGSVFPLFRAALAEIPYLPQSSSPSVPVYAYRVSALMAVRKHYVAGSSQDGMRVAFGDAPGLRDDQKDALGFPDRDASPLYATAYAASGSTIFSYPVNGLDGWNLPYPWFSRNDRVERPQDYQEIRESDSWAAEERAWAGADFPVRLEAGQREAADASATSLRAPGSDYERNFAEPKTAEIVRTRVRTDDGKLRLSATHIEELSRCPFAWLLSRGLALEEEISGVGFFDARLAGRMAHEVLHRLYERISASGPFDAERLPEYRSWTEPAVERVLPAFEREHGPFLRPMFEAYVPKLTDRIGRLLEEEARSFRGWSVRELEGELSKDYPELNAILVGRLDRLAFRGDEYAVIDYKKNSIPKAKEVYPDADGNLADLQMAAYVLICETAGMPISRARYWSLESAAALDVLGPDARSRDDYGDVLAAFEEYLMGAAGKLRAGDFRPPRPEERNCSGCGWQSVCRVRYATE